MSLRLPNEVEALIRAEQARSGSRFIDGVQIDAYLIKVATHADVLVDWCAQRCRGLVAYYANDTDTRRAFITLVLVEPEARGTGLGAALVTGALAICRARGFSICQLEVHHDNAPALAMYRQLGFAAAEDRGDRTLMEIAL